MKTSETFSVLIWADKKNSIKNQASLYARITVNQKRVSISLKRKVDLMVWDPKRAMLTNRDHNARLTNKYIDQVKSQLFQAFQELKGEGKLITSSAIKERYLGTDTEYQSLQDLIDYHKLHLEINFIRIPCDIIKQAKSTLWHLLSKSITQVIFF